MDAVPSRGQSPTQFPVPSSIYHHPYFTPTEVEVLSEKQRGKVSIAHDERLRQQACGFLEAMGTRAGFPRRTIATAQHLYHRFHLFFPRKSVNYSFHDVCLASLYVSTKMHDTLKKPNQLLAVSYAVRFPELAAKSKHPGGELDLDVMDSQVVEHDRFRLFQIEKIILGTICYNFTSRMPFKYVIKIGRAMEVAKNLTQRAWRLAVDCYRTLLPLQYPPHTIALGSLYIAALLSSFEQAPPSSTEQDSFRSSHEIVSIFGKPGDWETKFKSQIEDLEDIVHTLIDLMLHMVQNSSANTSPSTPSSPSPHPQSSSSSRYPPSANNLQQQQQQPVIYQYNSDQLIRLKIALRENEHPPRSRQSSATDGRKANYSGEDFQLLASDKGTFRFLFGPPGAG